MDGVLHVLDQLGQAHKQALAVISELQTALGERDARIAELAAEQEEVTRRLGGTTA